MTRRANVSHKVYFDAFWKAVNEHFSKTFVRKVGEKFSIVFTPLTESDLSKIVSLSLDRLNAQTLAVHGFTVQVDEKVRKMILAKTIRDEMGPREIDITLQNEILSKLALGILSSDDDGSDPDSVAKLHPGDVVIVSLDHNGEVVIDVNTENRQPLDESVPALEASSESSGENTSSDQSERSNDYSLTEEEHEKASRIMFYLGNMTEQAVSIWMKSLVKLPSRIMPNELLGVYTNVLSITKQIGPDGALHLEPHQRDMIVLIFLKMERGEIDPRIANGAIKQILYPPTSPIDGVDEPAPADPDVTQTPPDQSDE